MDLEIVINYKLSFRLLHNSRNLYVKGEVDNWIKYTLCTYHVHFQDKLNSETIFLY